VQRQSSWAAKTIVMGIDKRTINVIPDKSTIMIGTHKRTNIMVTGKTTITVI